MYKNSFIDETNDFIIKKNNNSFYPDFQPSRKNGYKMFPNDTIRDIMQYLGKDAYECYISNNELVIGHHDGIEYYEIRKINDSNAEDILERNGYDYEDMIYSELNYRTLDELYNQAQPLTSDELLAIELECTCVLDDDYEDNIEL